MKKMHRAWTQSINIDIDEPEELCGCCSTAASAALVLDVSPVYSYIEWLKTQDRTALPRVPQHLQIFQAQTPQSG